MEWAGNRLSDLVKRRPSISSGSPAPLPERTPLSTNLTRTRTREETTGILAIDLPGFIVAQLIGAVCGLAFAGGFCVNPKAPPNP